MVGETIDTIAPIITAPANINAVNTANQCSASLSLGTATATDNIAVASLVGIRSDNKLLTEPYPVGITTITWTASDAAGNASSATETVTVNDTQPPALTVPATVTINTSATNLTACNLFVSDATLGTASANDNCTTVTVVGSGVPAGNLFPVGTTTITYSAKDLVGNITTATQLVTVLDKPPSVISCPANITTEFTSQSGAIVNFTLPTATDNCGGTVSVTSSKASGSAFPIGVISVLLTAKDAAGNTTNCSFTVTVTGPRIVKQNVLGEMTALKNALTNQDDKGKLTEAITRLSNSLQASLWIDETHLKSKDSSSVFDEEKETVKKLMELIKSKKGVISDAILQGFITRLTRDDRQLAFVTINESSTANGNASDIAKANDELSKGDADIAAGKYGTAIEHYLKAWKAALKAVGKD